MRDNFVAGVKEVADRLPCRTVLLTADLGFGVFDDFSAAHPNSLINVGVAEQALISVSAGLASTGFTVYAYSIAPFLTFRCLEQIRVNLCYHELGVNLIGSGGGFSYGQLGFTHHATEDIGILAVLPNIEIYTPSSQTEANEIARMVAKRPLPSYTRLDRSWLDESLFETEFEFGLIRLAKKLGDDFAVVCMGGIVAEAVASIELLKTKGYFGSLYTVHSIKPFDIAGFARILEKFDIVFMVEEHQKHGGLGSTIYKACDSIGYWPERLRHIAIPDVISSEVGDQCFLRDLFNLSAPKIAKAIEFELARKEGS